MGGPIKARDPIASFLINKERASKIKSKTPLPFMCVIILAFFILSTVFFLKNSFGNIDRKAIMDYYNTDKGA